MNVVHLSPEQDQLRRHMDALANRFDANPALKGIPEAVDQARILLQRAADANVPSPLLVCLQLVVNRYDNEAQLPAHLRDAWFKGS